MKGARIVSVTVALLGLASLAANATPIMYDFTVTATSGPLSGTTATGDFTFDSSSIIPGGANGAAGLLTSLDFTWDGITYNAGTANTGFLLFDAAGDLTFAFFGSNCHAGFCSVSPHTEEWVVDGRVLSPGGLFVYATPTSGSGVDLGRVTLTHAPEPATLALLGIGLAGLGYSRRKRKQ